MFKLHLKTLLALVCCVCLISACGNGIKSDIIKLDQAVTASGMNDDSVRRLQQNMSDAKTIEELNDAVEQMLEKLTRYNQAIERIDFKSDEVRSLRDELGTHNRQLISALQNFSDLNIRSGTGFTPEREAQIRSEIKRIEAQAQEAEKNLLATLKKLKALGAENGVDIQLQ